VSWAGDERPALGILGGSFNPPHVGHLIIASDAWIQLGLEHVLFVPAAAPPHKHVADSVSGEVRLEMTRLAVADDARFAVTAIEVDRGLRYTIDTVAALQEAHPRHRLEFIVGSDSLLQFATWHRPRDILAVCRLAVALRPGDDRAAVLAERARWGQERVTVLENVGIDLSSSQVRERVRRGTPIRYLVPAAVEETIAGLGLYRAP
jgi:nicotinate-nucleotide adenylyltransferase